MRPLRDRGKNGPVKIPVEYGKARKQGNPGHRVSSDGARMSYPPYAIKAFRENGTPTVNETRHFETLEAARKEAQELAEYMLAGYVQVSKYDSRPEFGFYTVVEHYESKGAKHAQACGARKGWETR
jgi:hypothetical protein